jgi:alkylation response protein AidB-like acyl-CoA dehydrogenase
VDFGDSPSQAKLRQEAREFIAQYITPDLREEAGEMGAPGTSNPERAERMRNIRQMVAERGWRAISWPVELGGHGGKRTDEYVLEEEFARAGVNVGLSPGGAIGVLAAINAVGSPEQKATIPDILSGKINYCLGFTEPSGGADLASLQCRAVLEGDTFIVNGQKIFTSGAHVATHIYLMCRTDPEAPKHRGISILLIPMNTPGITVRPLWTIQENGPATSTYHAMRTNETFFDDVRVPRSALLGELNRGWYVGAMGLNLDRVGAGRLFIGIRQTVEFIDWLNQDAALGHALKQDVDFRDKVADLHIESKVCRMMTQRSMSIVERGGDFTYEGSAEKVFVPEHAVHSVEAIGEMLGPFMQLVEGPEAVYGGQFASSIRGAYLAGVNHGSVQIMRDQVAVRGLGLPRAS